MFWIMLGALLVLLIRNNFNAQGVAKDIRRITRTIGRITRDAVRTIRQAAKEAKKETVETKGEPVQTRAENETPAAVPEQEPAENGELFRDPGPDAGIAAMLANVPTLEFPEDDPKYDSSRKYRYA